MPVRRFSMILTTKAGGLRLNRSVMPVPPQFEWTRVNTLKCITTLQACIPSFVESKICKYNYSGILADVIFIIIFVQLNSQFLTNCFKATFTSHKPEFSPLLLLVPLFLKYFSNISSAVTRRRYFL